MKLYEITDHLKEIDKVIEQYAEENEGFVHPELMTMLDGLHGDKDDKLNNCIKYFKGIKREAEAVALEKKYISKRLEALSKRQEAFKQYIEDNLDIGESWKGSAGTLYWTSRESVQETNIDLVPDIYVRKELARKKELMADLKNGATVEGVQIQVSTSLCIR